MPTFLKTPISVFFLFSFASSFQLLEGQANSQTSPRVTASHAIRSGAKVGRDLLAQEPEIKAAGGLIDSWNTEQQRNSNDPNKQSNALLAVGGYAALRNRMVIIDRLEVRLQDAAIDCGFCADKQAELSELLREELAWEVAYASLGLRSFDPIGDSQEQMAQRLRDHYGQPKMPDDPEKERWSSFKAAYQEAAHIQAAHCRTLYPDGGNAADACRGQNSFGENGVSDSVFMMARGHERAWSSCFVKNNWVADDSKRKPYEDCMAHEDPITKMCAAEIQVKNSCPKSFTVRVADVNHLLNWSDRFAGHEPKPWVPEDPAKVTVEVFPETGKGVDITLIDQPVQGSQTQFVSIRGVLARSIVGSSYIPGAIIAIPKGTPASLAVQAYGSGLNIYLTSLTLSNGTAISFKNQIASFPARPPAGYPGIPNQGQTISFPLAKVAKFSMLKSEFDLKAQEYSASLGIANPGGGRNNAAPTLSAADDFKHRRIYARSTIVITMTEDLVLDPTGKETMIRGEMQGDITDPNGANHPDMVHFSQTTDVFLRIKAEPSETPPLVEVTVTADHVVSHGLNIPLTAKPLSFRVAGKEKTQTAQSPLGRSFPRPAIRRQPSYESLQVVKKGARVVLFTTADTFVANATRANQAVAR